MPIITGSSGTGSYYYPGLNVAQASYKSVDIRGSTDHQGTASGLGRLYVLSSSGDLYYLDPDGNQVVVASSATGSGENVFDNVYVSSSLLVKGDTVLSGNVVVGGQIYDLNSNLILSSAVGSVIAASGSLDFPQTDKAYHVRAVNSHLILSSSAGSVVALSASQDFVNSDKNYHIRAVNSHLILSSSAGSRVTVSGNIHLASSSSLLLDADGDTKIDGGSVNNTIVFYTGNSQRANLAAGGLTMASTRTIVMTNGSIYDGSGHLILSSTVGSVVALSASQDFANSDKTYHIRAVNSDLVLSSSATSVVALSSALDFQNIGNKNYTTVNRSGHLILSSSAGSIVTVSGSQLKMIGGANEILRIDGSSAAFIRMNDSGGGTDTKLIDVVDDGGVLQIRLLNDNATVKSTPVSISTDASIGLGGTPTTSAKLDIQGTDGALLIPRLTNAQKDALTPSAGMILYNSSSGSFQVYTTSWKIISVT